MNLPISVIPGSGISQRADGSSVQRNDTSPSLNSFILLHSIHPYHIPTTSIYTMKTGALLLALAAAGSADAAVFK